MKKVRTCMSSALNSSRDFVFETLGLFGVVTVLKAVMVPHALLLRPTTAPAGGELLEDGRQPAVGVVGVAHVLGQLTVSPEAH